MTEAERWLAQAKRDLDDARFAASFSEVPLEGLEPPPGCPEQILS